MAFVPHNRAARYVRCAGSAPTPLRFSPRVTRVTRRNGIGFIPKARSVVILREEGGGKGQRKGLRPPQLLLPARQQV